MKIEGLPSIVETVLGLLSTATGSIGLAIFIFIYLLSRVPQSTLAQSFFSRKKSRISWLKDLSLSDDQRCRSVVEDIRNAMIFEQATGIYAENIWRKGLFDLHDRAQVSWTTMRRARKFMEIRSDGSIYIRLFTISDQIEAWFNATVTWVFIAMATIVLISVLVLNPTILTISTGMPLSVFLYACAVGAAFQNAPKHAANIINEKLNHENNSE